MIDTYLRTSYQTLLVDPLVRRMQPINPNVVTLGAAALGLTIPFLLYLQAPLTAIVMMLLSGYLDTLDGSLARAHNCSTPAGTALDIFSDRVVEFSVILGLYLVAPESRGLLSLLMLGAVLLCITSFLVVGIFTENRSKKGFHYSPGIIERGEAFTFFLLMILFPHSFALLAITFTLLVLLTAIIRITQFTRQTSPSL